MALVQWCNGFVVFSDSAQTFKGSAINFKPCVRRLELPCFWMQVPVPVLFSINIIIYSSYKRGKKDLVPSTPRHTSKIPRVGVNKSSPTLLPTKCPIESRSGITLPPISFLYTLR